MRMVVEVMCRNEPGDEIGRSHCRGRLVNHRGTSFFVLYSYRDPNADVSHCISPITATVVQLCATGYGLGSQ